MYGFYLELLTDLFQLLVYFIFFTIIFTYYSMPLHIVRDLYMTFKGFKRRIADFLRYRRVTSNMNERYAQTNKQDTDRSRLHQQAHQCDRAACRWRGSTCARLRCGGEWMRQLLPYTRTVLHSVG